MGRSLDTLAGGGEMGARIRAHDWGATPLGPIETWPACLKTSLSIILGAQMPMWLGWGREMLFFYNDAYIQVLSLAKHPSALGRPAAEVWKEIWHVCGPLADRVFDRGEAPFVEDVRLFMDRGDGFLEEVYYSFSYSPIRDESGQVGGLFCPNTEVTGKLLNARRLRTLSALSEKALVEKTTASACASAAATLAGNPDDVPFALLYLAEDDGSVRLEQCVGLERGVEPFSPLRIALDGAGPASLWPLADAFTSLEPRTVAIPDNDILPHGLADQRVGTGIVLPLSTPAQERPLGVLVAGVNPSRRLDDEYTTFYELVSGQVATALQNALAAEEERRRADMLAEIDRAKTTFFSNVSHELRTPLTLMIGPTEDALASPERALTGESLQTVYRNELRLLKLVSSLLDFSRLEAGRMAAAYQLVDVGTFTADLVSGFRAAIERAGLSLEVDAAPLTVAVDREMWEKIVLNLLSNALKFTLEGGIRVALRRTGERVELTVADTGTGIPAEELPRLFERFHRVENPRARTHEGSGIGLALVQELARLHDGSVRVESEVGAGSTFTVTIPVRVAAARAARAKRESGSRARAAHVEEAQRWTPADTGPSGEGAAHLLLADDNADMRDYLRRLLEQHWRVSAVGDGAAALALIREQPVDLVLSDVMMPRMDGFALLDALRQEEQTRHVPVILVSARAGDEARVEGLGAGADDYLVKPFSARELIARVRTHLEVARARRRAEDSLAELYDLFMQVPAAVTVCRGEALRCAFQNTVAIDVHDVRGQSLLESGLTEDALVRCQRVAQTGERISRREVFGADAWHGQRSLSDRFWDETWSPVRLPDGRVDGVIVIALEVTDRVTSRRQAEQAEERRRMVFDAVGLGTFRIDAETGLDTRDAALNRLLGLPERETTQPLDDFFQRLHPEDRPWAEPAIRRSVEAGEPFDGEVRVLRTDGTLGWIRALGRAVRDARGGIESFIGVVADVTDRKRAEEQREVVRQRLHAALAASDIGTYFWDIRRDAVQLDDGVKRLFGFAADEVESLDDCTARVHEEDRQRWLDALAASARHGADFNEEVRVIRPDGTVRWLLDKGQLFRDHDGEPSYMTGAVVDITEQKHLAEGALAASRVKDEFLAMLGHELRNPLAPIVTALELMRLRGGEPSREQHIIQRQIEHLIRLVDDLLDISRVTRGLVDLKRERCELDEVIDKAIEIATPLMEQKGHRLAIDVPTGLAVDADPVRLAQVFANLLSNAARYTPSGGNVRVIASRRGDVARVRVVDDGAGVDPELIPRIFDLFVQGGGRGPDRSEGGLGIGLALVKRLVEMHGGEVDVHSDGPGRGSSFTVELPLTTAWATASRAGSGVFYRAESEVRRVLVVDDNIDAAEMLADALRFLGHDVALAHDGPQALAIARETHPDVAVLDIGLPVMDGYELARRLRVHGYDCKLIALTGYGQKGDREQSRLAGFHHHLVKPIDLGELRKVVEE